MKWFIELEEKYRNIITAVSWVIFAGVALFIDSTTKGSSDGVSGVQTFIILFLLAVAIVFTLFAARTHDKEKKAREEKEVQAKAEAEAKRQEELRRRMHETISIECEDNSTSNREFKGKSLLKLIDDYVVIDLETTGLIPSSDAIIEIGAIRYSSDTEIARFHSFVSIDFPLDPFIIEHTGITDAMLEGAPKINEVLPRLIEFVGESVIIAHNANFDINFLYDAAANTLNVNFSNDFIDTMRLARNCGVPVKNHKLVTLARYFGIPQDIAHRATADCETTHALYVKLKEYINTNSL